MNVPSFTPRLQLAASVVITAAAIAGLGRAMPTDPSKIKHAHSIEVRVSPLPVMQTVLATRLEKAPRRNPELDAAFRDGDLAKVQSLYVNDPPLDGLLTYAAQSGKVPLVKWLFDHEVSPMEGSGSSDAPLLMGDDHPEITAFLREHGAPEETLSDAAAAAAVNAITRLLAANANPNPPMSSPLANALTSYRGTAQTRKAIVERLLAAGADPNHDAESNDPVESAFLSCTASDEDRTSSTCFDIAKLLVAHGARARGGAIAAAMNLDETHRDAAFAIMMTAKLVPGATAHALVGAESPTPAMIKALAKKGIDWGFRDGEDDAALPLISAVQKADRDLLQHLLDAGAPADRHYRDMSSALGSALDALQEGGDARIVEMLVQKGANPNRRLPDGRTPLFAAAESGDLRALTFLLDHGARVNELVLDDTALDAAEQHANTPAARVLHAHGGRRARGQYGGVN